MLRRTTVVALLLTVLSASGVGLAAGPSGSIVIRNQQFMPGHLELPPGVKVKLTITNEDVLPVEFESFDLSRELIVPVNQSVTVFVGPLSVGKYGFFNDFNPVMRGLIEVTPVNGERH